MHSLLRCSRLPLTHRLGGANTNQIAPYVMELQAKARHARAEIRADFEVELEALAGDRALAQVRLQELRRHGEWAWEDLKDSAERTWNELREAIERSASCFE